MKLTDTVRRNLRLQTGVFVVLFLAAIALLAWVSRIYAVEGDWTAGNRNSLSQASRDLLAEADAPIKLTAYASDSNQLRQSIRRFVRRYERADVATIKFSFVNLNARPQKVRDLGIKRDGQLVVTYQGRTEVASQRTEQAVTRAIQRAMQASTRHVRVLTGHGEHPIDGRGRNALSQFAKAVENAGSKVESLNLAKAGQIPAKTDALVIPAPQQPLLKAEVDQIKQYLDEGGRVLWLADKKPVETLKPLAKMLGVGFEAGTAVDPKTRVFGIPDPTRVLVASYPKHPVTEDFASITMFPGASGLSVAKDGGPWSATTLLQTGKKAWLERGALAGELKFNKEKDGAGPITLGVALKRDGAPDGGSTKSGTTGSGSASEKKTGDTKSGDRPVARAVVVSDSDFLTNGYLRNGGNRQLGLNLVHWLTSNEELITVKPAAAPGTSLDLPSVVAWGMPIVFLGVIPAGLLAAGGGIWLHRRRL